MELILTGGTITGKELQTSGVVNKVLPRQDVLAHATKLAERIGSMSGAVTKIAKQAVLTGKFSLHSFACLIFCCNDHPHSDMDFAPLPLAENSHIVEGMSTERLLYYSTFSLSDFKEGQAAFLEKRPARFQHH